MHDELETEGFLLDSDLDDKDEEELEKKEDEEELSDDGETAEIPTFDDEEEE